MADLYSMFNQEYRRKLDALALHLKNSVSTGTFGARKSSQRGSSLEFSDFKNYSLGDDIKYIDWNSFARLDKLFVKLFHDEKEAHFNIFLDTSKSMDNDTDGFSKAFYQKLFAASLSYIALNHTDNVNLFTFNRSLSTQKRNIKDRFQGVLDFLESLPYQDETHMGSSFGMLLGARVHPGIGIVLSDFFSHDGFEDGIRQLQYRHKQDVCMIQILSAFEINPNFSSHVRLIDSENGHTVDIPLRDDYLAKYDECLKNFSSHIRQFCKKQGVHYIFVNAETDDIFMTIKQCLVHEL